VARALGCKTQWQRALWRCALWQTVARWARTVTAVAVGVMHSQCGGCGNNTRGSCSVRKQLHPVQYSSLDERGRQLCVAQFAGASTTCTVREGAPLLQQGVQEEGSFARASWLAAARPH